MFIHTLFEHQALLTPDAPALVSNKKSLTYHEVNQQANQLAHYLMAHGVGPDVLVGIVVEHSPEMVIGLLAILKAGGAYIPLDPTNPAERLAYMVNDSFAPILLTQQNLLTMLPPCSIPIICLDHLEETTDHNLTNNPKTPLFAANLAYVIYTSGSTGRPKGVAISHANLLNYVHWHLASYNVQGSDRVSQVFSFGFDALVLELWPTLTAGASLHFPSEETRLSPPELRDWVVQEHITIACAPTSMAEALLALPWPPHAPLRFLLIGGEQLHHYPSPDLPFVLVNHYGPTEGTVVTTATPVPSTPHPEHLPSIGRPIANVTVLLLDAHGQPVPPGLPGELCLAGAGIGRGYLSHPDWTAERFLPHPFGKPGERLYHTGDRVRFLADGSLEFLGRMDRQVKLRGYRIEPGEIEMALLRHPAVHEAAVCLSENRAGNSQLVAYLVPEKSHLTDRKDLYHFLQTMLPTYMIPTRFIFLEKMPLNANQKIDRNALSTLYSASHEKDEHILSPLTPTEHQLAQLWTHYLGEQQIEPHANFFELGGHSLLAMRLILAISDTFKVKLSISALFDHPTLAALAQMIDKQEPQAQIHSLPLAAQQNDFALSYAQRQFWLLHQWDVENPVCNEITAYAIQGSLNAKILQKSLHVVVQRHAMLRTTFPLVNQLPVQHIAAEQIIPIDVIDLTGLSEEERSYTVKQVIQAEGRKPFDLPQDPLLRVKLIHLDENSHYITVNMHHTVSDGWSLSIFLRELTTSYQAFLKGQQPLLPALPVRYSDFSEWQHAWLQSAAVDDLITYWKRQITGASPVIALPTTYPAPSVRTFHGAQLLIEMPSDLVIQLQSFRSNANVTLFMALFTAWAVLLYRYSGQDDLVIGTAIAARTQREVEGLIGAFVNALPLRIILPTPTTFHMLLRQVHAVTSGAYAHQELPFEKLVDALHIARTQHHFPLFQILFVLQNDPATDWQLPGAAVKSVPCDNGTSTFDITLEVIETSMGLSTRFQYNTDLFDTAFIMSMAEHYQHVLARMIHYPHESVTAFSLLSVQEQHQLFSHLQTTMTDYSHALPIHELVQQQATHQPEALAVVCLQYKMTYGELNRRANQLAHSLQQRGVGPEVCVGICVDRTPSMLVGLLGILKSGGAYVPLDPLSPSERLAWIVEDTHAPLVLTQKHLAEHLSLYTGNFIYLESDWEEIAQESGEAPHNCVHMDNLAYVIYTSGSTGRPKGVAISHANLLNYVHWHLASYNVRGSDRISQVFSFSFDAFVQELWPTLTAGASLHFPSEETRLSPPELRDWVVQEHITIACAPTSMAEALLALPWPPHAPLRFLLIGGEQLHHYPSPDLPFVLVNHYGPTEGTVVTTATPVPSTPHPEHLPSIGRPIANVTVLLLDAHGQPVPPGLPGELCLAGAGIGRGYLSHPDWTAERFLPHPFGKPGERLYHTGDRVRFLADGSLEFLGRMDRQVKLRGYRIEPGEIEMALLRHPAVHEAVVTSWLASSANNNLIAYIVAPTTQEETLLVDIRHHMQQLLPTYMQPALFITLPALPLTPNGKIDYASLPVPDTLHSLNHTHPALPQTPIENSLSKS